MLYQTPVLDDRELAVLDDIQALRSRLSLHLRPQRRWHGSLRRLSLARAIQGSNSIEGIAADLDDSAAVALGETALTADGSTVQALAGYRDAMTYVLALAHDEPFAYSTALLKSLHFMMTKANPEGRPGLFRRGPVYVHNQAEARVVYEGPPAEQVPELMEELVAGLNLADQADPIVRAAMAHLNLVLIHPYTDGNGRMSRTLQSLVLARGGVVGPEFLSIEEYLGANTPAYYAALAQTGRGQWNPEQDARAWLRFALLAHLRQGQTLVRRIQEGDRLWVWLEQIKSEHGLVDRLLDALFDAASGLQLRNGTYRAGLLAVGEPISDQTATRDLRLLAELGLLVPQGERRGRVYLASPRLRAQASQVRESVPAEQRDPFA